MVQYFETAVAEGIGEPDASRGAERGGIFTWAQIGAVGVVVDQR